jgi:DNA repair exonuclease SbcCD ATPase subunit
MGMLKLKINAFRGISNPLTIHFDPEKKITLFYGQNGDGKTSIIDALACLLTDHWGSVEDKSFDQSEYQNAIISKGKSKADVSIELDLSEGKAFKATFNGKDFVKSGRTPFKCETLYRAQLSKLIDNTASERYKQIGDYLDLDDIINAEEKLSKLIKSLEDDITKITAIVNDNDRQILSFYAWMEMVTSRSLVEENKRLKTYRDSLSDYNSLSQRKIEDIAKYKEYKAAENALNDVKTIIAEKTSVQNNFSLITLLESTANFLNLNSSVVNCPVCQKPDFDTESTKKRIESEIKNLNDQKTLQDDYKRLKDIEEKLKAIVGKALLDANEKVANLKNQFLKLEFDILESVPDDLSTEDLILSKFKEVYAPFSQFQNAQTDLLSKTGKLETELDGHQKILSAIRNYSENLSKLIDLNVIQEKAKETLKLIRDERIQYTDYVLKTISDEVNRLYALIHPEEKIGNLSLYMNEKFKSSLYLSADFYGASGISPQSVYSESHLDTAGLCVFIALAKLKSPANTILILDDILTSIDEDHLDRTINMLHHESENFSQLILSTHYRSWFNMYKFGRADREKVQIMQLNPWSLQRGVSINHFMSDIADLTRYLGDNVFNRKNVANCSGSLAESVLTFLSLRYQCKVPHKADNRYTLAELISAFSSKIRKVLRVEKRQADGSYVGMDIVDVLNRLQVNGYVRNIVGAHYNESNNDVSDTEIRAFAYLCLELANAVHCPETGKMPDKNKSGSYWQTSNDTIRLHPLTEPRD